MAKEGEQGIDISSLTQDVADSFFEEYNTPNSRERKMKNKKSKMPKTAKASKAPTKSSKCLRLKGMSKIPKASTTVSKEYAFMRVTFKGSCDCDYLEVFFQEALCADINVEECISSNCSSDLFAQNSVVLLQVFGANYESLLKYIDKNEKGMNKKWVKTLAKKEATEPNFIKEKDPQLLSIDEIFSTMIPSMIPSDQPSLRPSVSDIPSSSPSLQPSSCEQQCETECENRVSVCKSSCRKSCPISGLAKCNNAYNICGQNCYQKCDELCSNDDDDCLSECDEECDRECFADFRDCKEQCEDEYFDDCEEECEEDFFDDCKSDCSKECEEWL